jgi:hypothetical protein
MAVMKNPGRRSLRISEQFDGKLSEGSPTASEEFN